MWVLRALLAPAWCFLPASRMTANLLRQIERNWKSGLTVALISLPLSLSLAIASGAAPITGIITAIWAGFVGALLGGSEFNVIGPAGALSGILASFALTFGAGYLPMLAMISGLLIIVFYFFQWDKYLVFIPSSVMYGFTLGVGLTIALGQVNAAFGLKGLPVHDTLLGNFMESLQHVGQADPATAALFLSGLVILFALVRFAPRVPGAVVIAIIGIAVGYCTEAHILPLAVQTLYSKYGSLQATIIQVPAFTLPPLDLAFLKAVFTVAVVAVLETLLSAKIVDTMTGTRFDQRREVRGLAFANIASGLMGGLPATGVLVRTALNVKTGATSRVSSALNAIFVLIIALLLFWGFQYLPLAAVASILVFASIRMVDFREFKKLYLFDQRSFWLAIAVAVLTFAVDPMIGILVGATISLLGFVAKLSQAQSELTLHRDCHTPLLRIPHHRLHEYEHECDIVVYRFAGELTYFNGKSHEDNIRKIKAKTIILSLRNLLYIDLDGLEILREIVHRSERAGHVMILTSISEFVRPLLESAAWFREKNDAEMVFKSTTDALTFLGFPPRG